MRTLITGGPGTGKTTYARALEKTYGEGRFWCTDPVFVGGDLLIDHVLPKKEQWSAESVQVARWFDWPYPWIIEGVVIPRALRKWQAAHPGEPPPCDQLIVLDHAWKPLTPRQEIMEKGVQTVLRELLPWLGEILVRPNNDAGSPR